MKFYSSSNGDDWLLRQAPGEQLLVKHVPNGPSGGATSEVSVDAFLSGDTTGPEHAALRKWMSMFGSRKDVHDDLIRLEQTEGASRAAVAAHTHGEHRPDSLLLAVTRIRTFGNQQVLTNASGFFFKRAGRLFLSTSRHVLCDETSAHFPDRIEFELHIDANNLGQSVWFSIPLYKNGRSIWRQAEDGGGPIDVAIVEIEGAALPQCANICFFEPQHLVMPSDLIEIGSSVLIVGFPLGFHDSLHHLPVARQGILASAFGFRFQGKGAFVTDARMHRGTSGAPVVARAAAGDATRKELPWIVLGVHSSSIDMSDRDAVADDSLGLNSAWYADVLLTLTEK